MRGQKMARSMASAGFSHAALGLRLLVLAAAVALVTFPYMTAAPPLTVALRDYPASGVGYRTPALTKPPHLPMDVPDPGLTPPLISTAYDTTPLGTTGKGQTIVFFEWGGYNTNDLDTYAKKYTPNNPFNVTQPPGGQLPTTNDSSGPSGETMLDLEAAHAVAPDARLVVVDATATIPDQGLMTAAYYQKLANLFSTVDQQYPGAVWSSSIGWGCDRGTSGDNANELGPVRTALATAHSHGTSSFDAAGDTGGLECKENRPAVDFNAPPGQADIGLDTVASLPEMTDVGGTTMSTDAHGVWVSEETWVDPAMQQGTGGGVSALWDRPAWQANVSVRQDSGQNKHRLSPDVAAVADPNTGFYVFDSSQGGWQPTGGTSLAAPMWAGFAALMNQYLTANGGHPLGDLNPVLYQVAVSGSRPAFHDVIIAGNDVAYAEPHYDLVSGWGTPDVNNLVLDILDTQKGH
jgi:kumamolisin